MPTYEYECRACNHNFERFQSMAEDPVKVCPQCGGAVRRLIGGGSGVIFKGSGFYVTDSKKSSSGSTAPAKTASTAAKGAAPGGAAPSTCAPAATPACANCPAQTGKESA